MCIRDSINAEYMGEIQMNFLNNIANLSRTRGVIPLWARFFAKPPKDGKGKKGDKGAKADGKSEGSEPKKLAKDDPTVLAKANKNVQYISPTFVAPDVIPPELKQPIEVMTTNYNKELHLTYAKKVQEALKRRQEREILRQKVQSGEIKAVERRKRRIYDRPKYDIDISKYTAWRSFEPAIDKAHQFSHPVVCRILLPPKHLKKIFGEGNIPSRHTTICTREYDFEDCNLDLFLLYDYKGTTTYWGPNKENYNYEDQSDIHPRKRIQKHLTPEEFWESEEPQEFALNCVPNADWMKFKRWIIAEVEKRKTETESFEDRAMKKHPWAFETFDDYEKNYEVSRDMLIFRYSKEFFLLEGEKLDPEKNKYHRPVTPLKKLDDQYLIIRERDKIEGMTPAHKAKTDEQEKKKDSEGERRERRRERRDKDKDHLQSVRSPADSYLNVAVSVSALAFIVVMMMMMIRKADCCY
eukprot:TRINITY_DN8681_c0_g1_i3.p1 TRINITY_DN8681_c0_g1~~TRINITY_DN8681_c0_g1_i3.p1  ORF type:complete len:467 (+),score=99.95 TRINITY_DN8681_c0_g1_i3:67-1467(+)